MLTDQEKLERYFEYDFLSKTHKELENALKAFQISLKARPGDIQYSVAIKQIKIDIAQLQPKVMELGNAICQDLATKYDWKFEFLKLPEKKEGESNLKLS